MHEAIANVLGLAVSTPLLTAVATALLATLLVQLGQRAAQWPQLWTYVGLVGLLGGVMLTGLSDASKGR